MIEVTSAKMLNYFELKTIVVLCMFVFWTWNIKLFRQVFLKIKLHVTNNYNDFYLKF